MIGSFHNEEMEIKEAPELFRGDFILQLGSVEIGDLISEQISISEENDEKTMESTKIPLDTNEETDKKIAPDPPNSDKGSGFCAQALEQRKGLRVLRPRPPHSEKGPGFCAQAFE